MKPNRRQLLALAVMGVAASPVARAAQRQILSVFKSPHCDCCDAWVNHVAEAGFGAEVHEVLEMQPIKLRLRIPPALWSCHTATVGGYVIEGHVPAPDIARLLAQRPIADGLAVAGMPIGSPGMEQGGETEAFSVILFGSAGRRVFSSYHAS